MAPRTLSDGEAQQIGAALKATRERIGWTPPELAERAGTTTTNIHRMERGERGGFSLSMLFALVAAMDCSWREVLGAEPGSDGDHSTEWEAGFRAGLGEAHAAISSVMRGKGLDP